MIIKGEIEDFIADLNAVCQKHGQHLSSTLHVIPNYFKDMEIDPVLVWNPVDHKYEW